MSRMIFIPLIAAVVLASGLEWASAQEAPAVTPDTVTAPSPAPADTEAPPPPTPRTREKELTELSLFSEEELVVTPARHLQAAAFSPSIVSVITEEDIRGSASNNLADVFRSLPGMDVLCSYDTQTDVVPRGLITYQSAKVLVLVNGQRVNNDFLGSVLWRQLPVSLNDIHRIEVVRGPGSALYGANALVGLINIITKRPRHRNQAQALARYGNFSTREGYLAQAETQGKIGYSISGGYYRSGGWGDLGEVDTLNRYSILGYSARSLNGMQVKIKDQSLLEKLSMMVDAELPQGVAMEFDAGFVRGRVAVPEYSNIYNLSESNQFNSNVAMRLSRPKLFLDDRLQLSLDHVVTDIDSGFMSSKTRRVGADMQYNLSLPYKNMAILGLGWEEIEGRGPSTGPVKRTDRLRAAYIQDEYTPTILAGCNLTAGLRVDQHSEIPAVVSPRAALSVSPVLGHIVRMAVGSAFRKPNFIENYYYATTGVLRIGRGMSTLEGNVNSAKARTAGALLLERSLKPESERIFTYEVGYEAQPLKFLTMELNLFQSRVNRLIGFQQFDSIRINGVFYNQITVYSNLRDVENRGAEIELRARPYSWLYSFVNFTYQEVKDVTDPDSSFDLKEASRRKVNVGLRLSRWGATGNIVSHCVIDPTMTTSPAYVTLVPLNRYNTIDVSLNYGRILKGFNLSATLSGYNILNKRHVEYPVFGSASYVLPGSRYFSSCDAYLNRNALNDRKIMGTIGVSF